MRNWIRGLIIGILTVSLLIPSVCSAEDYDRRKHNRDLEQVLFESGYAKNQSTTISNNIEAIENAVYLTIDQFHIERDGQITGENEFEFLKQQHIHGLPWFFSTIDYEYELNSNGKRITANTHRAITHQGWDRHYELRVEREFWKHRRQVLLGTINTILDFGISSNRFNYDARCEALCGLIYYVHIIGDYIQADKYQKVGILIDLAGRSTTDQLDIISQLRKHLLTLFANQKEDPLYKELIDDIDRIDKTASELYGSSGNVNTDEEFVLYRQCAIDLLEALKEYIPRLLKKETYFSEVFYPNLE